MTDIDALSLERFRALADAYGGVVARWPANVRNAAMERAHEPAFAKVLAEAFVLDELLDSWTTAPARGDLAQAIAARAPMRHPRRTGRLFWWPGLGLATALAGASAGIAAATVIAPTAIVSPDLATAFGDLGNQES